MTFFLIVLFLCFPFYVYRFLSSHRKLMQQKQDGVFGKELVSYKQRYLSLFSNQSHLIILGICTLNAWLDKQYHLISLGMFFAYFFVTLYFYMQPATVYEKGIIQNSTFYPFEDIDMVREEYYIRLSLKETQGEVTLTTHKHDKEKVRNVLCDRVAYEQIFW